MSTVPSQLFAQTSSRVMSQWAQFHTTAVFAYISSRKWYITVSTVPPPSLLLTHLAESYIPVSTVPSPCWLLTSNSKWYITVSTVPSQLAAHTSSRKWYITVSTVPSHSCVYWLWYCWIWWKDPRSPTDQSEPSAIFIKRYLSEWLTTLTSFGFSPMTCYFSE